MPSASSGLYPGSSKADNLCATRADKSCATDRCPSSLTVLQPDPPGIAPQRRPNVCSSSSVGGSINQLNAARSGSPSALEMSSLTPSCGLAATNASSRTTLNCSSARASNPRQPPSPPRLPHGPNLVASSVPDPPAPSRGSIDTDLHMPVATIGRSTASPSRARSGCDGVSARSSDRGPVVLSAAGREPRKVGPFHLECTDHAYGSRRAEETLGALGGPARDADRLVGAVVPVHLEVPFRPPAGLARYAVAGDGQDGRGSPHVAPVSRVQIASATRQCSPTLPASCRARRLVLRDASSCAPEPLSRNLPRNPKLDIRPAAHVHGPRTLRRIRHNRSDFRPAPGDVHPVQQGSVT